MFKLFSRSKPSKIKVDFNMLKADMHSHLIPGIDDGSPDMETSLQLTRGMMELGYQKLITTPHIMWDMYRNSRQTILEGLEQLRSAVKAEAIDVEINAAAEYFLDEHIEELIKNNEPLLTISANMVLVEFSMAHSPMNLKDILFEMQMRGYQPVIAHPERYTYLANNKEFYDEMKDIGCMFQLNLLALGGHYGKPVHDLAQYLVKKEYYDLVGSDLHHIRHLAALNDPALLSPLKKLLDSGKIRNEQL
jgi:tyrosine-protein phosphatase YwqE